MDKILFNLKAILKNFKASPKKALNNSYSLVSSNEVSSALIIILAILSGISNTLIQKYLPIGIFKSIDNYLLKCKLGEIGKQFKLSYNPNLFKYFILGFILFIIVLVICASISYIIKTYVLRKKEEYSTILKATSLLLIPATIFIFLSSIAVIFSIMLYSILLILSASAFVIYSYQYFCNIADDFSDKACFICSILLIVSLFAILKINVNTDISTALSNVSGRFLESIIGL